MALTLGILAGAAVTFWAGFLAPRQPRTHQARAGFVALLALAAFTGYFAWREYRTVEELAALIEPVPKIAGVQYVPTPSDMQAIAGTMAAIPGKGRFGPTQEERRALARKTEALRTRYWLIETELGPAVVLDYYRRGHREGWELKIDDDPVLMLSRPGEQMMIFVDEQRGDTSVLYAWQSTR